MARIHSWILPFLNTDISFSGINNADQNSSGIVPSPKIIKLGAIKGKEKSPWRVPNSSRVIQKKKLKAKHRKSSCNKMAHNQNWSNSDKSDKTDCCK
jgi:hypothetical protein